MFSSVGVLSICSCYYCSFSLPSLLRRRPHVSRLDFRLSLPSERGLIPEQRLVIDTYFSWTRKHFFASKIVLQVIVSCLRGAGSMSSSRRAPRSFHGTVFFGAPLAFLRGVKFFFPYILFLEASQKACFVVASFSSPYFFGSSFPRLSSFPPSLHKAHTGQVDLGTGRGDHGYPFFFEILCYFIKFSENKKYL